MAGKVHALMDTLDLYKVDSSRALPVKRGLGDYGQLCNK